MPRFPPNLPSVKGPGPPFYLTKKLMVFSEAATGKVFEGAMAVLLLGPSVILDVVTLPIQGAVAIRKIVKKEGW